MRRVPRRSRAVASVAAATASLLAFAFPLAASAAAPGPVGLPVMPTALAPGQHCTGASPTQAHAQPWTARALSPPRVGRLSQGAGVTVGVVDTGVSTSVPTLAGRVTAVGDAGQDCVGHGSFAAGLIAGSVDSAVGGGVAPQARILAVRGTDRRGGATPGLVAAAIRTAVDRGARVVYVGAALTTGREELTAAVAYATRKDVLVVAPAVPDAIPATNSGAGAGTSSGTGTGAASTPPAQPHFPAFIQQVVSVEDYGADGSRPKDAPPVFATDLVAPGDAVVRVCFLGLGFFFGFGFFLAAAVVFWLF